MSTSTLLTGLNTQQLDAVTHMGGPLMVVAGAGSGKTRVLTHRIAHLVQEHGVDPRHILAITFTNKAAREMKERVGALVGDGSGQPFVGTFHRFCGDVLRRHFHRIGGSNQYVIFDASDQKRLLTGILKELNVDENRYPIAKVQFMIEQQKNKLVGFEAYRKGLDHHQGDPVVAQAYEMYQKRLWQQCACDFTDLLFWVMMILHQCPDVLHDYQTYFKYVLVDEYQDTNHAQYMLIRYLVDAHRQLTVVGDFDQTIYSWRGATVENMLRFEKDYPDAKAILLEQNYRSTGMILKASNAVIGNNNSRREKRLWTDQGDGDKVTVFEAVDDYDEAQHVCDQIVALHEKRVAYGAIAILYRTNALSRVLEDRLTQARVPYRLVGGVKFFERKEVKDMVAYLRLIYNPNDNLAFLRIANVPQRDIGTTTLDRIYQVALAQDKPVMTCLAEGLVALSSRPMSAVTRFVGLVHDLVAAKDAFQIDQVGQLIETILEKTDYVRFLSKEGEEKAQERLENIHALIGMAREEELDLGAFLEKIALYTDLDDEQEDADMVTLMTAHAAKGLEFDYVFMIGLEEGMLPHQRSMDSDEDIEEERRLCYVGMTRAKKLLEMSWSAKRTVFGRLQYQDASRFLAEVPDEVTIVERSDKFQLGSFGASDSGFGGARRSSGGGKSSEPFQFGGVTLTSPSSSGGSASSGVAYSKGEQVHHSAWGPGVVISIEGSGDSAVLKVKFSSGVKSLMAKYAPLERL